MKSYLILLFVSLLFPSCGGSDAENRPSNADSSSTQKFTPEELRQISSLPSDKIEAMKEALLKEGLYDCCMKPGCTLCISQDQRCDCYLDIARKDPICGECFEGYKEGRGKLKLVSIVELERIRKLKKGSP